MGWLAMAGERFSSVEELAKLMKIALEYYEQSLSFEETVDGKRISVMMTQVPNGDVWKPFGYSVRGVRCCSVRICKLSRGCKPLEHKLEMPVFSWSLTCILVGYMITKIYNGRL